MTLSLLIYHLKYPFKLWMYELMDQWLLLSKRPGRKRKILIYRLDLIGDYLMCRPFFKALRDDPKYAGYQFAFAGNQIYKELGEWLDGEIFDDFLWIDRPRFINSIGYRFRVLKQIRESGFETVIYPSHTRQYWLESVVRVSGADQRITGEPIGKYMNYWELSLSQHWYSKVIDTGSVPFFEFFRNRQFFSAFTLGANEISNLKSELPDLPQVFPLPAGPYLLLAPGASTPNRQWPVDRFVAVAQLLVKEKPFSIVVMGSKAEEALGKQLKALLPGSAILNLAGKLSLPQSMHLLKKASLLIANESAPIHMAAITGTPAICISQGNHFGRWNPYPQSVASWIRTVYPHWFKNQPKEVLAQRFHEGSTEDISRVSVDEVFNAALLLAGIQPEN